MNTLKTTLVSALTLGAMTVTFAGDALADHKQGRGGKGRGTDIVDVYIDAGHNRQLERLIGENMARHNPYVNIVYSRRYADVTVTVDGYLSEPYRDGKRRYRAGFVAMDYDYKIKVRSRGRLLYKDRIYGQVSERLDQGRDGLHYNSYSKGDLAIEAFGIFINIVGGNRGYDNGYRYGNNVRHELTHEAYEKVAYYVAHIKIPRKRRRYR